MNTPDNSKLPVQREIIFNDLMRLDDGSTQLILREITSDMLVYALKGSDQVFRDKVLNNLSTRAAEMYSSEIDALDPGNIAEITKNQQEMVKIAIDLVDKGMISFGG